MKNYYGIMSTSEINVIRLGGASMEGKKRKRVRVRWGRIFGALLLLCVFIIGGCSVIQYVQGTQEAGSKSSKTQKEFHSFKGTKSKIGDTNILLLGNDTRGEKHSRTDTIMIAHYDQKAHNVKLISLMRDMFVSIPGHGKEKLNAAYAYGGPELLRQTITENFGVDIQYYTIVDFQGFEKAVDTLVPDGVEIDVPHDMSSGIGMKLKKGKQVLHGNELLGYVRFRHDRLSDFGRVQRQQEVVTKLMDESIQLHNVVKLPKLMGIMNSYIDTNMDTSTIIAIGKDVITKQGGKLETLRLPEDGTFENRRIDGIGDVLQVDFEQNKEALKQFLQGTGETRK
ncbi:LCP family protein [Heyndrickxia sporothermodurans]|uniref:Regulatory protein MsrR n=3 Tax=Heyndrickxia sporothermodurans TaxID=46224 RepID=A0A150LDC8_9BACI|nr:LCP family protein [Heyndrickxia sporothermodurans]KYD10029.1 hypothetical protein B4102_2442 [Heyndrickxia sporothermodurans]